MFNGWRWIFPARWPESVRSVAGSLGFERFPGTLLSLFIPEDCRLCGAALRNFSRIPVCPACLAGTNPFVAEYFCVDCHTPFLNRSPLDENGRCGLCRRGITGFDSAFSYGDYEGRLRQLIHLFKYGRIAPLARPLAALMATALPRDIRFDAIVPMPLHWRRRWQRGFNQSELLSRALSACTGIPVQSGVRRKRATPSQAGLSNTERRSNVAGSFAVKNRSEVAGRHVLLVDDVLTTGATASACASALKRAGAKRVTVLTLARVDRRNSSGSSAR